VTDREAAIRAPVFGARRHWDGQAYILWDVEDTDWSVIADVSNREGIESSGIWLGPKTEFLIMTGRGGPATLTAIAQPGPQAEPGSGQFRITLEDAAGKKQTVLRLGENRIPVDLAAGRGTFAITIEEPVSGSVPGDSDLRPTVLHLTEYSIERGGPRQP